MESEQLCPKRMLQHQQPVQQKSDQELLIVSMSDNVSQYTHTPDSTLIGIDLWKQIKRVTIPLFQATRKLLHLSYIAGEAPKTIENLGHSTIA